MYDSQEIRALFVKHFSFLFGASEGSGGLNDGVVWKGCLMSWVLSCWITKIMKGLSWINLFLKRRLSWPYIRWGV